MPLLAAGAEEISFRDDLFGDISGLPAIEENVFGRLNEVRAEEGLSALEWDGALAAAARQHSDEMTRLYYFSHESPTPGLQHVLDRVYSSGLTDIVVAENLASENSVPVTADAASIADEFTRLFLASEAHRENMLDPRYTHAGVGCVASEEGTLFCTQVFSRRSLRLKSLRLREETREVLNVALTLKTDDVVGVWVDETDTLIFEPNDGKVSVKLWFRTDEGARKVVFARRGAEEYGAMKGFFMGKFDPRDPFSFGAGITEVEVLAETASTEAETLYVLEAEGELLAKAESFKLADGDTRLGVKTRGKKFKITYPILTGTGVHEIYFVVDSIANHGLKVDTEAPLAEAFRQVTEAE
jgi:hypothetical protein